VFTPSYVSDAKTVPVIDRIDYRWIQHFMEKNNIVGRTQTGKLMACTERMEHIEKEIAYHLGVVACEFQSGALDENLVENADETHFVIKMDNGKTLGFRGDNDVKYADVVSGGMGATMLVRLTGGPGAIMCAPFIIFKRQWVLSNSRRTRYVSGVSYRTLEKGVMTQKAWLEWLKEPRAQRRNAQACNMPGQRVIFVDDYGGHNDGAKVQDHLDCVRASIRKLVACAADNVQPCDSFLISKIKDVWSSLWEEYKYQAIKDGQWASGSGAIKNPGKTFVLHLAAKAVQRVNAMRDTNGIGCVCNSEFPLFPILVPFNVRYNGTFSRSCFS
jgi:DDE superfamily endonuclease